MENKTNDLNVEKSLSLSQPIHVIQPRQQGIAVVSWERLTKWPMLYRVTDPIAVRIVISVLWRLLF